MKSPAFVLEGVAEVLVLVGCFCNIAALVDRPQRRGPRPPWRTTMAQNYRRHPRLFLTSTICLTVALACWIAIAIIQFT
jgi:hypothetical protein